MDVALLVNPAARSGARSAAALRCAERLHAHGVRTTVLAGGSASESADLLRRAVDAGADAVVVAGGDGTVRIAAEALAHTGVPLAPLPVGTGNDLATSLGYRERDAERTARAVLHGAAKTIDLGRIQRADGSETLFTTVLASGFDAKVNDRANRMRFPRGRSRYTFALLIEFARLHGQPFHLTLEHADGSEERVDEDLVMAALGNGPTYGGGIPICPDASLEDGMLDLTLVRPAGRLRLLRLLPRVYRGTHGALTEVSMRRVRAVRMEATGVTAYADGDPVGPLPLRADVLPGALAVLTP